MDILALFEVEERVRYLQALHSAQLFLFSLVVYKSHSSLLHQKLIFICVTAAILLKFSSPLHCSAGFITLRENEGARDAFTVQRSALLPERVNFLIFLSRTH